MQYVSEANSSQTCPYCLSRRKVRGRTYVCVNTDCALVPHRDAVGGVNIHTLAVNDGTFVPVSPGTKMRVKYLRAQPGWSSEQRERHGFHPQAQRVLVRSGGVKRVVVPGTGPSAPSHQPTLMMLPLPCGKHCGPRRRSRYLIRYWPGFGPIARG
ncbi:zinc ribbon domain-containing protein [Streptomyces ossamyceticus]|uniref:Zinc ribbon domain-containing protein n=1 Tax=Streptomyces ossamyceticus TaxID=249581 RepID=A0ABV2V6S1_9ACTN